MELQVGLDKIKSYFAHVSPDQLYSDLTECGLNAMDSWADDGAELAYGSEPKAYVAKTTHFKLEETRFYASYRSEFAEAA